MYEMRFMNSKIIVLLFSLTIFLLISYYLFGYFTLGDDTYIYLQFAKNVLENGEISFNAGVPTYGFTSPLWLALIVILSKLFGFTIHIPTYLSLYFALFTIVIWFLILRVYGYNIVLFSLALLSIVFDPNLLKHSYFGMEATLSYFLSSLIIFFSFINKNKHKYIFIGITIGIYNLVRPESVLIALILLVYFYLKNKSLKTILKVCITSLIIVIPWYVFAYMYFNQILPNTFYAKGGAFAFGRLFANNIIDSTKIFVGSYALLIVYILIEFFRQFRKIKLVSSTVFSVIIITALIIFYSLSINNELVYSRYYCITFPFIFYLFFNLFTTANYRTYLIKNIFIVFMMLSLLSLSIFYMANAKEHFLIQEDVEDNVITWMNANTQPNQKVVRGRIGKIGFYTELHIIDPMGLIEPEIIEYNNKQRSKDYFKSVNPDYIIGEEFDLSFANQVRVCTTFIFRKSNLTRYFGTQNNGNIYDTTRIYKLFYEK